MRSQPSRSTEPLPGGSPSRSLTRRLTLLGAWLIALVGLAGPAMAQIANAEWELGLLPAPAQVPHTATVRTKPDMATPKAGQVQVLQGAADWLITQQSGNGGFPWTVGGGNTPNTQGATALGLLRAYAHTDDATHLAAAVANGNCFLTGSSCIAGFKFPHGGHRFATHDQLFLIELSEASGNPAYADFVQAEFWDKLTVSQYGEGENLDAAAYAASVMTGRAGGGNQKLVAWDLSKTAIAADLADQTAAHTAFMDVIVQSLEAEGTNYNVAGLAGGLWAAARTGVELNLESGPWVSANNNGQLAGLLAGYQRTDGGFPSSSTDASSSAQATSFAVQALAAVNPVVYQAEIAKGFAFIASVQQPNGQFLDNLGGSPTVGGGVESHGETLEAYAVVWIAADRYVATTGTDTSNDCSVEANPCATIQHAVNEADIGNTIHVAAGSYVENVVIDRPVTLLGAQADVDAGPSGTRDGNGLGETVIVPAAAATGVSVGGAHATDWSSTSGAVIRITSDGVVVNGVVVDADNPDLDTVYASGRPDMNGANPDVAIGVNIAGRSAVEVINVVVRNPIYYGIGGTASALAPGDRNIIANSRIINSDGHGYGVGILLYESLYAHVDNNHIEQVRTGIQAQSLTAMPPTAGFEAQAEGNLIKATGVGIWANVLNGVGSPPTFHVRSNTIHAYGQGAEPTLTAQWNGIWVHSLTRGGTVSISGNSIDGSDVDAGRTSIGYLLGNVVNDGSAANVISGGSVSHVDIGVLATDSTRYDGPVDNFEVTDVDFSSIALAAFYVEDTQKGLAASSAHLSIGSDNSYDLASSAHTLVLSGQGASVEGVAVDDVFVRSGQIANIYGSTDAAVSAGTINNGIAAAAVGGVVQVEAGSFAQTVTIGKTVTLLGAQAGVDGRSRNSDNLDNGESVLVPPVTDTDISMGSYFSSRLIGVDGAEVVIDGFVLDGDNPDLTSGVDLNGADIDATAGILAYGSSAGLEIRNNIIRNMQSGGVFGYAHVGDNIIEFNRFSNIAAPSEWGVGVLSTSHWYAQVRDNLFDSVRIGVQSNLLTLANPGTLEPAILRNEFRVQFRGVFLNQNGGAVATSHRVEGNAFTAVAGPGLVEPWQAVWIQGLTGSRQIQITSNDIDGSGLAGRTRIGYYLNNIASTAAPTTRVISGGTVSNVDVGVLATDAGYYRGSVNDFVVRDVFFTGVDAALYVEDTTHTGNARLSLGSGNNFLGATWPVTLAGPDATLGTADGETGVGLVRVRAAQTGNLWGGPDQFGNSHAVAAGTINNGIAAAAVDGVVQVEAGSFAQAVTVNKRVRLLGAQAGVDAKNAVGARAGGETIISPDAPVRIGIPATGSGAEVDGFTITGISSTTPASTSAFSISASSVKVLNNRIVAINGNGAYLSNGLAEDVLVEHNHFGGISGGSYNGVKTEGSTRLRVIENSFDGIAYQGVQLGGTNLGTIVQGNHIANTVHGGINIGGGSGIVINDNTLASADTDNTATRAAIRIYGGIDAAVSCNVIESSNNRGIYFHSSGGTHVANVFHNAVLAGTAVVNGHAGEALMGSNWYGAAGAPVVAGTLIADPLGANPVGNTDCGNNTPHAHVLVEGSGQSANLGDSFGTALRSRVTDILGGAVVDSQVTLSAPAAGASAVLVPAAGVRHTDYNGVVETQATANGFAGTYTVSAGNAAGNVGFVLTNGALEQVQFDLNGPVTGVQVGDPTVYTGSLVNVSAPVTEEVFIRLAVTGATSPADVVMCVQTGGDCLPITWTQDGGFLRADVPGDVAGIPVDSFPITAPSSLTYLFNVTYGRAATFTASAEVVGATSDTVYASDVIATEVIDQHAGVELELSGPVVGVEKDAPTLYQARLTSDSDIDDRVVVSFVITRDGGIQAGDLVVEYDTGGGVFAPLGLNYVGGQLVGTYGPAGGFDLLEGHDQTTTLRVTYLVVPDAPGQFRVQANVVDAVPDSDGVPVYAGDNLATQVVEAAPDVELELSGPFNGEDDTLVVARVDESMVVRADLVNNGGPVADQVQASFTVGAGFDIQTDDLVARYWFLPGATGVCDTDTAVGIVAVAESEFTDTGNTLSISTSPQSLTEGMEVAVCFEFTFSHAGVYSIGTVIEDAIPDTDGLATYAADNLALTVGKGEATLAFDASTIGAFAWDGSIREAVVETDPVGLEDDVTITYNGDSVAPSNAGSYTVVATLSHADYEADLITGAIVIGGESVDISGIEFVAGGTSQVFDGSDWPVTFIADPAAGAEGIACDVSINGGASLPNTVGSYFVTVTCEGPNHFGAASNMLTITKATGTVQFAPLSGPYGTVHAVTASLAQSDSNVSCTAVSGVPAQSAAAGSYPISASCSSDNYTASGSAVYEVTAVDVVFTLDGDTVGVAGSDPETWSYFTATTANPNGITLSEQLVVDIAIERGGGIAAGDVVLEVEPWGAPGTWVDIPLALVGDVLTGTFGPYSLDPVSSEANLRARVARGGRYNVVATAAGVSSDATYASATHAVDVAQLGLSGSGNINGVVGTAVEGAYSLVNSGTADLGTHMPAPNDENVRGRFFIEGPVALTGASVPGCGNEACTSPDVAVEFFNPLTNAYQRIYNLRAELDEFNVPTGRLFGHFGALASGGQPVPAGATGTFLFRTTFLQHTGTYTVTSQVVGIDSGKVYAEAVPQTIGIGTGTAATIELVGGDAGEAVVGGNSYDNGDLVVRVLDAGGNPVAGAAVAYNVHAGGNGAGASFAAPDLTDSNGETAITALSNAVAGDFTVTASIGIGIDQSVEFVLRNVADDASQLHLVSGSGQTASLNQPFALPLVVRVTDQYGNPVAGELVDFLAPATGASADLSIPADPTDTNGETFVLALANGLPGSYVAEAGTGYGSVDFGLTNTAATADMLALAVVGSDEAVVASGSYTLQATVTGSGNAVPGVSVTFVVEPGSNGAGATTSNAVAITDINGVATATFNANTVAGGFVVRAVVSGVLPDADDVAMLTNLADAATTLTMVSGSPQSAAVNSAFAQPLMVRASDIHGNPIAGAVVDFAANGATANATLDPADGTVVTGVDGTAAVTAEANGIAGSYSVTALAAFGSPVDFALENTVGSVTISDIVWADSNAATVAYDGNAKAATATVAGSSAAPVFTYNGSSSEPVNAGTYLVIATVDDGNVFGSASAMLTIEPAAAGNTGIDLTGGSFVYDGTAKPAVVTNPDGVAYALAYDTGNGLAPVNAGSYTATLTVTDPNHAADTLTATIEITQAPVELVFGNLEHVYDGSAKAATVTTVPAGVTGVSLDYSQGGSPATPVDAGSYEVEATLANPNHVLTGITTAELVIDKATAQIFLSNLTQMYDGTQKAVTVTMVPAALAADVEVSYTPAVPVNVGSYAVEALLEGHPNYEDVSANATLSIIAATIAGFEIIGDETFSGVAGEALTGALPTVRVYDTSGLGVPGISVEFAVTAGAGSIEGAASAAVTTGADGQATVPEWVLGAVAGANTMTAATGMAGLQELEFSATGEQVAQLSIDKSVNLTQAHAGQVLDYSIVVANDGPSTVQATLLDAIPDGLEDISWICLGEDGALCGEASGNGDIDFDSTIPAGGSITVTISATVAADATTGQAMVNTAVVTWLSEGEEQEAEASASTNIVPAYSGPCSIFCDGFEDIDLGKRLALPEAADAAAVHGWDLVSGQSGRPQLAVELVDGAGQAVAWLDSLKIGEQSMVRLRSLDDQGKQRAGTWQAWPAGASVNYGWELDFDGLRLDFVPAGAAKAGLHLRLPAGAAIPERARSHAATAH